MPYASLWAIDHSIASMMLLTYPWPFASSTRSDTIDAPGATPRTEPLVPEPPIVPATCVPWPKASLVERAPVKSRLATIRPGATAALAVTPESMMATVTPVPVYPRYWARRSAPTVGTAMSMVATTFRSGEMLRMRPSLSRLSISRRVSEAAIAVEPASRLPIRPLFDTSARISESASPCAYVTMTRCSWESVIDPRRSGDSLSILLTAAPQSDVWATDASTAYPKICLIVLIVVTPQVVRAHRAFRPL